MYRSKMHANFNDTQIGIKGCTDCGNECSDGCGTNCSYNCDTTCNRFCNGYCKGLNKYDPIYKIN